MQREENGGIVISCDFCGTDWDEQIEMIEGHLGSVICLSCLRHALDQSEVGEVEFECTLCRREREAGRRVWVHPGPADSPGLNRHAALCWSCVRLGAKTFHKDKEIDFRWDPSDYPGEEG